MTLHLTPFWGCLIEARFPQIEAAARRVLPAVGVNLVDAEGFTCCPDPANFRFADPDGWLVLAARNLCIAAEAGRDMLTICSGCTSTFLEALHILEKDGGKREMVNERLERIGKKFDGGLSVKHVFKVLRDDIGCDRIRESVVRPLETLRVAPVYGCHLLKPSAIVGMDNPRFPSVFEGLISAIGATPIPYSQGSLCCGHTSMDEEVRVMLMFEKIRSAAEAGADCLALICPSCFTECDLGQLTVEKRFEKSLGVPALHYLQLMALAFGAKPTEVGIDLHRVKAGSVLEKLGIR